MKSTLISFLFFLIFTIPLWSKTMEFKIYLIPVGKVQKANLEKLVAPLQEEFGYPIVIGERFKDVGYALNKNRKQYHSTPILDEIRKKRPKDALKVLGIADEDLFVPSLNFVFGEADLDGPAAVISLTRLRQDFYGLEPDESLFDDRAVKESVHELGHCFGLRHCSDPKCVMHFSNSLQDTDIKSANFCTLCENKQKK
jgi:archaemetzincin